MKTKMNKYFNAKTTVLKLIKIMLTKQDMHLITEMEVNKHDKLVEEKSQE